MSDLSDDFKAHKQWVRERKEQRFQDSAEARRQIVSEALDIEEKNGGEHHIIRTVEDTIDFWPSSGRWIVRKGLRRKKLASGYDARSLLRYMQERS